MTTDRIPESDKVLWRSFAGGPRVASTAVSDLDFAAWLEGRLSEREAAQIDAAVAADPDMRRAALELAEAFRPEVILLDIGLPKMNGYEVARRVREQPWGQDMVLIAATGWGQEEDKRRSREAGFHFHMVKPVDPAELEKLLAELPRS